MLGWQVIYKCGDDIEQQVYYEDQRQQMESEILMWEKEDGICYFGQLHTVEVTPIGDEE